MEKIILQPAASSTAQRNFRNTVLTPVSLDRLRSGFEYGQYRHLNRLYPDGVAPVWGVRPSTSGRKRKRWESIDYGDIAIFTGQGRIFASSSITLKTRSPDVAADLWGTDDEGKTWEFIYLLDSELRKENIPYASFNRVVGYKPNFSPQGLMVLDEEKSERAILEFDFGTAGGYRPDLNTEAFRSTVNELEELYESKEPLDRRRKTLGRREQKMLRSHLFGSEKTSTCTICGRKMPVQLLVAAHIKKRSECTRAEKLDYKHNVAPMCKLGCDDLFENGFLVVNEGTVEQGPVELSTKAVRQYVDKVSGRKCEYWDTESRPYFKFHRERANG